MWTKGDLINEWMNDKPVYRTALATPGLLQTDSKLNSYIDFLWFFTTSEKNQPKQVKPLCFFLLTPGFVSYGIFFYRLF